MSRAPTLDFLTLRHGPWAIPLTPMQARIIMPLIAAYPAYVPVAALWKAMHPEWGERVGCDLKALDVHCSYMRRRFEEMRAPLAIEGGRKGEGRRLVVLDADDRLENPGSPQKPFPRTRRHEPQPQPPGAYP